MSVPVAPDVQIRPCTSRRTRALAWLLRHFLRPLSNAGALLPLMIRLGFLVDLLAVLPRPPRGTRRQRVQFDGYSGELILGPGVPPDTERTVLYFHGGAFFACGLRTHRQLLARLSRAAQARVLHVAYRQLPSTRLLGTVEDCVAAYRFLLDRGHRPEKIVFGGDSAGGYLVFAVALRAVALGLPQPAGIMALSPAAVLDIEQYRAHRNFHSDPYISMETLYRLIPLLAEQGGTVDPLTSSDMTELPPTLIQVGDTEVLQLDAELLAAKLADSGVPVQLQIWEGQVHVFQAFADLAPEGHAAITELGAFVRERIPSSSGPARPASAA